MDDPLNKFLILYLISSTELHNAYIRLLPKFTEQKKACPLFGPLSLQEASECWSLELFEL